MKKYAASTLVAAAGYAHSLFALGQYAHAHANPLPDVNFRKAAKVEDVAATIADGADILDRDEGGFSPLVMAAGLNSNPVVAVLLLVWGADVRARDRDGRTALHWAAMYKENPEVVVLLLDGGDDAATRDVNGKTPFDCAPENEHLKNGKAYWRLNDLRFR